MVSCRLTIFEGPDGSGKSTAARNFAELTGARYVHFGPLPHVINGLSRMYVEAMIPALLGYQDVVFDRCWLSELPYGVAFRNSRVRLSVSDHRMLERLAMRCGAVVIRCQPDWKVVEENYNGRKETEMLNHVDQLRLVYDIYSEQPTSLPILHYDYTRRNNTFGEPDTIELIDELRMPRHPVCYNSAGNWEAKVAIITGPLGERGDSDPWYQGPFISFDRESLEQDLIKQISGESGLLWLGLDDLQALLVADRHEIIAVGPEACKKLGLFIADLKPISMTPGSIKYGSLEVPIVKYRLA